MALNRDEIRQRIDALECMKDVQQAIEDVHGVEWAPGDSRTFSLDVTVGLPVTYVRNVPPVVLLAGLRAMENELAKLADVRETVDLP